MSNQHSKQGGQEDFVEITEKYNSKGFLVERYYMKNGEQVDPINNQSLCQNPVVGFYNPKIDYVKFTKRLTPEELKQGKITHNKAGKVQNVLNRHDQPQQDKRE